MNEKESETKTTEHQSLGSAPIRQLLWTFAISNVIFPIIIALVLELMMGDGATTFSLCRGKKKLKNVAQGGGNTLA